MAIALLQGACSVFGVRSEETPKYEVVQSADNKQIRLYSPYILAQTVVQGDFSEAQSKAFRILAGYIFGGNEKKQNIAMTGPVVQGRVAESEKIAMTAPVTQTKSEQGWVMSFMMPSKYKLQDLPIPKNKNIVFVEIPERYIGAFQYSGFWSESINDQKAEELKKWLATQSGYEINSGPQFAGYNPPWTLPFLRRNEIMFELKKK